MLKSSWSYSENMKNLEAKKHKRRIFYPVAVLTLKFIDEKEIDVLTIDNENNLGTRQPKKALYQCQHCSKSCKKELPFIKDISKCSTTDEEVSSKDESMIGM